MAGFPRSRLTTSSFVKISMCSNEKAGYILDRLPGWADMKRPRVRDRDVSVMGYCHEVFSEHWKIVSGFSNHYRTLTVLII